MSKIYFSHYSEVTSMTKEDAIKLCKAALIGNGYNLTEYESAKWLKGKSNKRENPYMRVGKRYVFVYHCLDWSSYEWENLLSELVKEE